MAEQQTVNHSSDVAYPAASDVSLAQPFDPIRPQAPNGFADFGHISLQKVCNTRDLGGLPTADGRHIRRDRLIRSGDPHRATKSDQGVLVDDHQLVAIFDLRTQTEIKQSPDPVLQLQGVSYIHESVLSEDEVMAKSLASILTDMQVIHKFRSDALEYMQHLYVECVMSENGKQTYRRLFELLLDTPQGAVLWHCTQGKDRTGLAAYLIEFVLGVSTEHRKQDYLATNLFMDGWLKDLENRLRQAHVLKDLDFDIEAYTYASPLYLDAALSAITAAYGSLDEYVRTELGLEGAQQKRLQDLYLE